MTQNAHLILCMNLYVYINLCMCMHLVFLRWVNSMNVCRWKRLSRKVKIDDAGEKEEIFAAYS